MSGFAVYQGSAAPQDSGCSKTRLIPRRWTHRDELEGGALRPCSVVVHLVWDIVDNSTRAHGNGVVFIEFGAGADQEGPCEDGDESLIRMRVRLTPNVGAAFGDLHVQTGLRRVAKQGRCFAAASIVFPFQLIGQSEIPRIAVDGNGFGAVELPDSNVPQSLLAFMNRDALRVAGEMASNGVMPDSTSNSSS
jgi:hypothetical protein